MKKMGIGTVGVYSNALLSIFFKKKARNQQIRKGYPNGKF
jgi:hypothetical protein